MSEAAPSRSRARQPKANPWGRTLLIVVVAILVLIPVTGFAALKGWVPAPVVNAVARLVVGRQPGAVPWDGNQPANILVMGLQIGGVSTNPLTDSLMVVSYQPDAKQVAMLSIPRDLYVEIPGHGSSRINEAFQDGGAYEAMITVQQNLAVPVNYYALVSYGAVEKLIDDVGGVTVDVPKAIDDPTFPAPDEIHFEPFHIDAGTHHLNGREALRYMRTRHADTDFGRAERQQQVIKAVMTQMMKPQNWFKLGLIMRDLRASVRTNFPFDQMAGLGLKVLQAGKGGMKQAVLQYANNTVSNYQTPQGASVLIPNPKTINPLIGDLFGPSLAVVQGAGKVRVDNGNGYKGAATGFTKVLTAMGLKPLEPGDADRTDYPNSKVIVYSGDRAKVKGAKLIAGMLGASLEEKRSGGDGADVVVILGRDYAPFVPLKEKDWDEAIKPR